MQAELSIAQQYLELGWNPVAAARGGKMPLGQWKRWQDERVTLRLVEEMFGEERRNIFLITGSVSRLLVLDCDDAASVRYWKERLGDALEQTSRVRTGSGFHYYFRLPEGAVVRGRSSSDPKCKWDIRAEGGGVIAPPSMHKSGRAYKWTRGRGPEAIQDVPAELLTRETGETGEEAEEPRSVLSHLLNHPPEGEGNRNNWLAKVAGHFAKHLPFQDAYETAVRDAATKLKPPLPENEIAKMLESIWNSEQAKEGKGPQEIDEELDAWRTKVAEPTDETGWLVSGGTCILCQIRIKNSDGQVLALERWMDADLRVIGVVEDADRRVYEVELRRPNGEIGTDALESSVVADRRKLSAWLANHGVAIGPPDRIFPSKMPTETRLVRYLEAQEARTLVAVPALGWHKESESFITHEGVIRKGGPGPHEHVRPDPLTREWAPYRYRHGGKKEARAVLREVLTFHHEETASVFGSWWAACLLKPQIQEVSSQFPFMALEAASESGKTTGFFSLMLQLSGNAAGHSNPTRAALRDYLSAHNSGIVWMDDLDSLENFGELLRNVTVGGAIVKKGQDNRGQVSAKMRAALVVSGEALGLGGQKALLDRAVLLKVQSPTGRRSVRDSARPQWDDVLNLREKWPDLNDLAGSVVELALEQERIVREFKKLRVGAGRFADKLAVVRLGSRVLAKMLEDEGGLVDRVDRWSEGEEDQGAENALTISMVPRALAMTGWKDRPEGPDPGRGQCPTPAFVDKEGTVWFSPTWMAVWWREHVKGRVDPRIHSEESLMEQARALGLGGAEGSMRKQFKFSTNNGRSLYWKATPELSHAVLNRSRGEAGAIDQWKAEDGDNQGSLIQ